MITFVAEAALPFEISPQEVRRGIEAGENIALLDVREPDELALARIAGAKPIPMGAVPANLQHIDALAAESTVVVFCHHGVRSLNVVNWLRQQGVDACQSMAGGIDRWSLEIDSNVPRYS